MSVRDSESGILAKLRKQNPRFHRHAYAFVLDALHLVIESLEERRHISGEELANGVRGLALQRFGPIARTVLEYWGIHSTDDLGEIVFALVEIGVLVKEEDDQPEDFRDLYDFGEAFERDYPWTVA